MAFEYQRLIDIADHWTIHRTGRLLGLFVITTLVFSAGLGNVSTESGTEQFAEEVPASEALTDINQKFGPAFGPDAGSTQLIQSSGNVLSRKSLLAMLRAQYRLEGADGLRVESTSSAARIVARTIDPSATTLQAQINTLERSTPAEIDRAVRIVSERNAQFTGLLSTDFNRKEASASATIGIVTHSVPAGISETTGTGGSSPLTAIQLRAQSIVGSVDGDIRVFGSGIFAAEFSNVIGDSLIIVVPAAVVFIVFFLILAYRDLLDLLLGMVALGMTIVWTFGFMGLVGIPFNQILIAVPPLLLAVGIDFGIHSINRYREERVQGYGIERSIKNMTDQIVVAFFIVTTTTVIGFLSNFSSALVPIKDFGIVASVGIVFTFLIFGIFLPAAKIAIDRLRERYPLPTFSQTPFGSEGSRLGRALGGGVTIARTAPVAFLFVVLLVSAGSAYYATDMDTSFSQEDFLPPETLPPYLTNLPEPFAPSEYTAIRDINFLEEKFTSSQDDQVTIYVEGPMEQDFALEMIDRASQDPPKTFLKSGRRAQTQSIISVIQARAAIDPSFERLIDRNDLDNDGIPDDNLEAVYDALLSSPSRDEALTYITADRRATRVVYSVESDASQEAITADARQVADRFRFQATATGEIVVFQAISDLILESAVVSLSIALGGTVIFLIVIYWLLKGVPSLGIVNTIPIVVTVCLLAGTMRFFGIAFNAFTATILAITIGLGIDYSVHITHRFADEYLTERGPGQTALRRTVVGTGGALAGSMLTTVFGIGVLVLSIFPAIGQFGILTAVSVFYAFLSSVYVLPSALIIWSKLSTH